MSEEHVHHHRGGKLLAFVLGGVIGAALAILYAPETGDETRRKIKDTVDEAGEWAKETYDDAMESVSESGEKIRQIAAEKKTDLVEAYEAGKEAFYRGKEKLGGE